MSEWVFRLTVTDDDGATHFTTVTVPIGVSGFAVAPLKVKVGGVFITPTNKIKVGGSFVNIVSHKVKTTTSGDEPADHLPTTLPFTLE